MFSIFFKTFSKILGFLFGILIFIIFLVFLSNLNQRYDDKYFNYLSGDKNSDQNIAIMKINGPIISELPKINNYNIFNTLDVIYPNLIKKYLDELKQKKIKGLIISINSPGGSVSATQQIYEMVISFKKENSIPIFFHSSDMLASGGYWLALSGDKIFADYGAVIGSIGVKGPDWIYYNNPTSLSQGILGGSVESSRGLKLFTNTAGKSKDLFNPFRSPSEYEKNKLTQIVTDIYEDFVTLVSYSRKIEEDIIKNEIGAMIYNTQRAKENFLI
ncbi:S49 family peptidase, partial [Alphaproteobacteria bacterium]|nr:S49 family peptidase [Alphaproteobacteria bacterium]